MQEVLSQTSKIPVELPACYFDFPSQSSPTSTAKGNNNSNTVESTNSITRSDSDPKEMDLVQSCIGILTQGKVNNIRVK